MCHSGWWVSKANRRGAAVSRPIWCNPVKLIRHRVPIMVLSSLFFDIEESVFAGYGATRPPSTAKKGVVFFREERAQKHAFLRNEPDCSSHIYTRKQPVYSMLRRRRRIYESGSFGSGLRCWTTSGFGVVIASGAPFTNSFHSRLGSG
jgi:hypothetical protein